MKVGSENYITIQGFMVTDLKLKGNELLIYACIYGFSQTENQLFTGSLQYLADWTNSTKQGVSKCLKSLVEKGLIVKNDRIINGVKFCEYYATKFNGGMQQSLTGYATKFNGGMQQSLTNNIDIYNSNITKEIDIKEKESVNTKEKEKSIDEVIALQKEKLQEPLREFVKMRKSIKKPITTHGLELVISKLRKLSGGHISVAAEIINQSIMNGWQGVFALKEEPATPTKKKSDGSEYANLV